MIARKWGWLAVVLAFTGAIGTAAYYLQPVLPEIVQELRALPEVARVTYRGPTDARLVVVHLRDWQFVPRDLAEEDGVDFDGNNALVEKVQVEQLAIARYLIKQHGVPAIYSEGLSAKTMRAYRLRINLMRELADGGKMPKGVPGTLWLEIGAPGRLLMAGEIKKVLPLEDADALDAAAPVRHREGLLLDDEMVWLRRQAMTRNLQREGLALIVLSGSHDLGAHLGGDVLYVQVTPRSYPAWY